MTYLGINVGGTIGNPVLNDDKVRQSLRPNDHPIPDGVHKPARGEYLLEVFRADVHGILRGRFHSQGQRWKTSRERIDIQYSGWGDGIDSNAVTAEGQTAKNDHDLQKFGLVRKTAAKS